MVYTLAALPSSLAITTPALDILLLMLEPRCDIRLPCRCRIGSDLVLEAPDTCLVSPVGGLAAQGPRALWLALAILARRLMSELERFRGVTESLGAMLGIRKSFRLNLTQRKG